MYRAFFCSLFTVDSINLLFLSVYAARLVLACTQSSTTRHSACLWRCISHLVFGILPLGFFDVLLANCVSSGVGCWTSETMHTWPFLWAIVEYTMYVVLCVGGCWWVHAHVWKLWVRVCVYMHAFVQKAGGLFGVTHRAVVGHWISSGHQPQQEAYFKSVPF